MTEQADEVVTTEPPSVLRWKDEMERLREMIAEQKQTRTKLIWIMYAGAALALPSAFYHPAMPLGVVAFALTSWLTGRYFSWGHLVERTYQLKMAEIEYRKERKESRPPRAHRNQLASCHGRSLEHGGGGDCNRPRRFGEVQSDVHQQPVRAGRARGGHLRVRAVPVRSRTTRETFMTGNLVLSTWGTPNGLKPLLMLEELGAKYDLVKIDIGQGEQKTDEFTRKNKNQRIPVLDTLIDGSKVSIAESAAILIHLAETHDNRFLPKEGLTRAHALQWTMFQMSGVGPMFGQLGYWRRKEDKNQEAIERYLVETKRIYGVLNERLGEAQYLAGDEYTIADMTTLFWARAFSYFDLESSEWPHVQRWIGQLEERPAVQKTLAVTFP